MDTLRLGGLPTCRQETLGTTRRCDVSRDSVSKLRRSSEGQGGEDIGRQLGIAPGPWDCLGRTQDRSSEFGSEKKIIREWSVVVVSWNGVIFCLPV